MCLLFSIFLYYVLSVFVSWLSNVYICNSCFTVYFFPGFSSEESNVDVRSSPPEQVTEISLWERLGKAAMLDIESSSFSWNMLSSLHHTEHGSSAAEQSDDEMNKAVEV